MISESKGSFLGEEFDNRRSQQLTVSVLWRDSTHVNVELIRLS